MRDVEYKLYALLTLTLLIGNAKTYETVNTDIESLVLTHGVALMRNCAFIFSTINQLDCKEQRLFFFQ